MEKEHVLAGNINHVLQKWSVQDSVESQVCDSLPCDMDDDINNSILCLHGDDVDAHLLEHDYYKKATAPITYPFKYIGIPVEVPSTENSIFRNKSKPKIINFGTIHCHMCTFVTKPDQLYSHIEIEHDGEYMWKCKTCLLPFITEERYNNHNRWCKNSWCKSHACIECNNEKLFVSRERLVAHIQSKHNGIFPFKCGTCSEPLVSKFDEECHKAKHDQNLLRCSYCGKVCKSVIFREQHMMGHIKNDHTCYICENVLESKDKCFIHLYQHIDCTGGYVCHKCEVTFKDNYRFSKHAHLCQKDEVSLICETCGKIFENLKSFNHHIRNWHGNDSFECEKCDATYNSKEKLRMHINRVHSGHHVCEVCKKTLVSSVSYRRHLLTHTDEYPFSCDNCDKVFRTKANLNAHTRQHTGEKPYSCSKCGVKFTHNVVRKAHEAKCTDDRQIDKELKPSLP